MSYKDHPRYDDYLKDIEDRYSKAYLVDYFKPVLSLRKLYELYPDAHSTDSLVAAGNVIEQLKARGVRVDAKSAISELVENTDVEELKKLPQSMLIDFQQIVTTTTPNDTNKSNFQKLNVAINVTAEAEKAFLPLFQKALDSVNQDTALQEMGRRFVNMTNEEKVLLAQRYCDRLAEGLGVPKAPVFSLPEIPATLEETSTTIAATDGRVIALTSEAFKLGGSMFKDTLNHEMIHVRQVQMAQDALEKNSASSQEEMLLRRAYLAQFSGNVSGHYVPDTNSVYRSSTSEEHAFALSSRLVKPEILFSAALPNRENILQTISAIGEEANKPFLQAAYKHALSYQKAVITQRAIDFEWDFSSIVSDSGLSSGSIAEMFGDGNLSKKEIIRLEKNLEIKSPENIDKIRQLAKTFNEGAIAEDGKSLFQEMKQHGVKVDFSFDALYDAFEKMPTNTPPDSAGKGAGHGGSTPR